MEQHSKRAACGRRNFGCLPGNGRGKAKKKRRRKKVQEFEEMILLHNVK